jgi:hypothetical protein
MGGSFGFAARRLLKSAVLLKYRLALVSMPARYPAHDTAALSKG